MSWPCCSRARWSLAAAAPPLWRACAGDERFHRMSQCSAVEDNKSPGRNVPVSAVPARMCVHAFQEEERTSTPRWPRGACPDPPARCPTEDAAAPHRLLPRSRARARSSGRGAAGGLPCALVRASISGIVVIPLVSRCRSVPASRRAQTRRRCGRGARMRPNTSRSSCAPCCVARPRTCSSSPSR